MKYRSDVGFQGYMPLYLGGHGHDDSWRSNTSKAYTNGSIMRQYFSDTNYFQLASEVFKNQSWL